MKGWETQLPTSFPIERLSRDAVREGERRRGRRRRRYQIAASSACALLLLGTAALVVLRDEPPDQVRTGPAQVATPSPSGTAEGQDRSEAAAPARAAANGKIAFIRRVGSSDPAPKIYVMDEDGSGQTMIAETTQGGDLTWSPDGTRLAFRDIGGIYVVSADGTGERKLPASANSDQAPAWSPDGQRIAVRGLEGRSGGIYMLDVEGTGRQRVTDGEMDLSPAWSPDGKRIAFVRGGDLYVVNVDGSARRRLTSLLGYADTPSWSPDGRKIAFRLRSTISVVDVDGGEPRPLASPGGTALANPGGQGANKLAAGRGDPADPGWSPDGTKITYALYQSGEACSVWVMNADGSEQRQLTDNRTCDTSPAWQPRFP